MGTLYLVATPIGNLEDITLRALRVLGEVSLIAAEDTRTTRKLLARYHIRSRLLSYNENNMRERTPQIIEALRGGDVALVSEAGTPGISDPGLELVLHALEGGFPVVPVPGPSALITALTISGLPARQFVFLGFPPRRSAPRRRLFQSLSGEERTLVLFESPHRLQETLADLNAALGDRRVAVCRELTKRFEEVFRGRLSEAMERFSAPRGEFTLVVEGAAPAAPAGPVGTLASDKESHRPAETTDDLVLSELRRHIEAGLSPRDAASRVAGELGIPRKRAYALSLRLHRTSC
jgi:16S rRNA (cytidine1402-2'-O)-methyltransferase